jgi:hypothetical protein
VTLAAGDFRSAAALNAKGEFHLTRGRVRVVALESRAELDLGEGRPHHRFDNLIEVDRRLPEGTPLFKDGELAGLVLLGSRFVEKEANTSFVVPVDRILGLCAESENHHVHNQEEADRSAPFSPVRE